MRMPTCSDMRNEPHGSSGSLTLMKSEMWYPMYFSLTFPQVCLWYLRLFTCLFVHCWKIRIWLIDIKSLPTSLQPKSRWKVSSNTKRSFIGLPSANSHVDVTCWIAGVHAHAVRSKLLCAHILLWLIYLVWTLRGGWQDTAVMVLLFCQERGSPEDL